MPIAKISGQGLSAMAVSVAVLWGCLAAQRIIVYQVNQEVRRTLQDMRYRQMKARPHSPSATAPVAVAGDRFPIG